MSERRLLGLADVSDHTLRCMVADSLGVPEVELISCRVEVAPYDLEALTTAGRYWVRGTARHGTDTSPYAFFVKVVQSWTRTPQFSRVPEQLRALAAAGLPWQTEPSVYRSDLGVRLPAGLSMPRAYAVVDLDDLSAALWLEAVDVDATRWRAPTFARAAYLLGRLAASPVVRPLTALGSSAVVRSYANGRLDNQVLPALRSEELWRHPLIAEAFDAELRARLLAAAGTLPTVLEELDGATLGAAHGDAGPRNLLVAKGNPDEFVVIDFGFWCEAPLGFDLSQLLLGELQVGERPAAELAELDELCVTAYVEGLHDEGCDASLAAIRRVHALLMLVFWGFSAVPVEVAYGMPPPGSVAVVRERARGATFVLDLVDATSCPTR